MTELDSQSHRRLIEGLVGDLAPVRRVPALRTSLGLVLLVAAGIGGLVMAVEGVRPALAASLLDVGFGGVLAGIVVLAPAATLAALAASIPGRENVVRACAGLAVAGLLSATAVVAALTVAAGWEAGSPTSVDPTCFRRVVLFALIPVALLVGLVLRGWVHAPLVAASLALLGAGGLGALVTHLSCTALGPRHLMVAHVLPVYVLGLAGAVPLLGLLRRFRRP